MYVQVGKYGFSEDQTRMVLVKAALRSKEKSTMRSYLCHFRKWRLYAVENGFQILPANEECVSRFFIENIKDYSYQTIKQISASISFFHRMFGYASPSIESMDGLVKEYVMKFSHKPRRIRDPILICHLEKIFNAFNFETCSLYYLRSLGILVLAFFGFLRFSDFNKLCISDVEICPDRVILNLHRSKTDRLRVGQHVVFDINSFPAKFVQLLFRRFRFNDYSTNLRVYNFK